MADPYEVEITQDGQWLMISVPGVDGLSQARRLADVERMARELIAVTLNVPLSGIAVKVSVHA